jgi:hypothetical protein
MADYYPLIAQAVESLEESTATTRRAIYELARSAMLAKLRSLTPASRSARPGAVRPIRDGGIRGAPASPAQAQVI